MRTAFIEKLLELAARDERIMFVTGDLGFGVIEDFAERFPDQFLNAGVAEQNMTGVSAGLALSGKVVFTYSIANFPTLRCLEQVRNDVCYHGASVKIVAVGGGLGYGSLGYTHHAVEDLAIMRTLPDMTVVAPGDPLEVAAATEALAALPGPAYLRLGKTGEPICHGEGFAFKLGKAIEVRRGGDVAIVSTGGVLKNVLDASEELSARGIEARVLSMHTVEPLDVEALRAAAEEIGTIVTVEEHSVSGGLGGSVAETLFDLGTPVALKRLGIPRGSVRDVGSQEFLRARVGLDGPSVAAVVGEFVRSPQVGMGRRQEPPGPRVRC